MGLDSTICETYGLAKEGARHHGYTDTRGYQPNVPAISRHPGPRAPLVVPIPPSRSPQPLQAAIGAPPANLPSTRIRARIIARAIAFY